MKYKIFDIPNNEYVDLTKYCVNGFGDVMTINGSILMNQSDFKIEIDYKELIEKKTDSPKTLVRLMISTNWINLTENLQVDELEKINVQKTKELWSNTLSQSIKTKLEALGYPMVLVGHEWMFETPRWNEVDKNIKTTLYQTTIIDGYTLSMEDSKLIDEIINSIWNEQKFWVYK